MNDIYKKSHKKSKKEIIVKLYCDAIKLSDMPTQALLNIVAVGKLGNWSKEHIDICRDELKRRNII